MAKKLNGHSVVDLDSPVRPRTPKSEPIPPPAQSRPRRQCAYCFTNRGAIMLWALQGIEDRALQALGRAHPEEFEELLEGERQAAQAATAHSWELHLNHKCKQATRVAGTASCHRDR